MASFLVLVGPGAATAIAATQAITVVDNAGVPKREIRDLQCALVIQARRLRHYWDTPVIRLGRGGWTLTLLPASELPAGAAGDHGRLPDGIPEARVGMDRWLWQIGNRAVPAWEVGASHELLEMLADPTDSGKEVCDPVESSAYLIDGVGMSAFMTSTGRRVG